MNLVRHALIAVLVANAFAGCLGIGGAPKDAKDVTEPVADTLSPVWQKVRDAMNGTACALSSVSLTQTSPNLKTLATFRGPAATTGGPPLFGEIDTLGNFTIQAMYNQVGALIINHTDPLAPQIRFQYAPLIPPLTNLYGSQPGPNTYDVKLNRDGTVALLGLSDRILLLDIGQQFVRVPFPGGTFIHPADYRGQSHMLATKVIGGVEYVFSVPSLSGTGILVTKLLGVSSNAYPSTLKLEHVTTIKTPNPGPSSLQPLAPHDLYIVEEDVDGLPHTMMYLANGFGGVVVMNIDDPKNPQVVASIPAAVGTAPQSSTPSYYHSIQMAKIEGKRIVATTSEVGYNSVKVFDLSDLRKPLFLGQWVFDASQPWRMEHNVQIVNGTLFVAHYTEGLFGFNLKEFVNDTKIGLRPVLHFQPTGGQTWDVVVEDGLLYVSDISQGLQVMGYGCFPPGDKKYTSTG